MSRWYRRYTGTVSDPKIAEAALIAGCSRAVAIATWDMILESAAESNSSGAFKATSRNVAATIAEQLETVEKVFQAFTTLEMIRDGVVVAWSRRQFQSDSSTERSRKHRASKKKDEPATEMQRCATPPYTESDTDTEKKNPLTPLAGGTAEFTFDGKRIIAPDSCRSFWLQQFDEKGFDLALIECAGSLQPNSRAHSVHAQVERKLAQIARDKRDRDRRYAEAAAKSKPKTAPVIARNGCTPHAYVKPEWAV